LGPIPNPQSPIPNPQSPIPIYFILDIYKFKFSKMFFSINPENNKINEK